MLVAYFFGDERTAPVCGLLGGGPNDPPSAPPAVPPIIINPYSYQTPGPAIDPHITPPGPPIVPPRRPDIRF